jgi:hypothetical protein
MSPVNADLPSGSSNDASPWRTLLDLLRELAPMIAIGTSIVAYSFGRFISRVLGDPTFAVLSRVSPAVHLAVVVTEVGGFLVGGGGRRVGVGAPPCRGGVAGSWQGPNRSTARSDQARVAALGAAGGGRDRTDRAGTPGLELTSIRLRPLSVSGRSQIQSLGVNH